MYKSRTVAVVVPCYGEETQIRGVLETMPPFVDAILVVDDCSRDNTVEVVEAFIKEDGGASSRVTLIKHEQNRGVGAAIVTGYQEALRRKIDATAVMAGDAQMDPNELASLVEPVVDGTADYAKGNRLFYRGAWQAIPRVRFVGNSILTMLTKIASGYWHSTDSQTGYTVISLEALELLDLPNIYPRYGCPNDILVRLNVYDLRVIDVPIRPVYNVGEKSGIRLWKVVPTMSWLIFKRFIWRMREKYIRHDFHPLVLFYTLGATSFIAGLLSGLYMLVYRLFVGPVQGTSALFSAILFTSGMQLLLFAMWFDMESNRDLCIRRPRGRRAGLPPDQTLPTEEKTALPTSPVVPAEAD